MKKITKIVVLWALCLTVQMTSAVFAGSVNDTALSIGCPPNPAEDPTLTYTLTNHGAVPVSISSSLPIPVIVRLTVKDSSGAVLNPVPVDSGIRSIQRTLTVPPGGSIELADWLPSQKIQTTMLPLSLFGYNLKPGAYTVSAKLLGWSRESASNTCSAIVN